MSNMSSLSRRMQRHALAWSALALLSACHHNHNNDSAATATYSLTATVSGLEASGLSLSVDGPSVSVSDGTTTVLLASGLHTGETYTVTVVSQPTGQTCSVAPDTGIIASANVDNIVITCAERSFSVGGTVSGLNSSGLALANGTDTVSVASGSTSFTLPTPVAVNSSFSVTVNTQPTGESCAVSNGSGTMGSANITSVAVSCTDQDYTVGGTVSGLGNNTGLTLANGSDTLTVPANATSFTMPTSVAFDSPYAVTVSASPVGLSCSVSNGAGTLGAANATNIAVTCADRGFTVGGTIMGLNTSGLVLANGSDRLTVPANSASFTMPTVVAYTGTYNITVQSQPAGEVCTVANGSGTMGSANVINVTVTCDVATETIGGTITGLGANTGLMLLNNSGDATPISANATHFTLHTGVAYGSTYQITVGTQPYAIAFSCAVSNGTGTAKVDVSSVSINCTGTPPTQTLIAGIYHFNEPTDAVIDTNGNIFVADYANNMVREIPFANGHYGVEITLGSGFSAPAGVALDANGNLFVADDNNGAIKEMVLSNGTYGAPVTIASGLDYPNALVVDSQGNVYVADYGDGSNGGVLEIPYSNGTYGTTQTVAALTGPTGIAMDAAGNLFVADYSAGKVYELPTNTLTLRTAVTLASGLNDPAGVGLDANGNVFVAEYLGMKIDEIPLVNGHYGAAAIVSTGVYYPNSVNVDANGNLLVTELRGNDVTTLAYSNGTWAAPVTLGLNVSNAYGVTVDANDNLFFTDFGTSATNGTIQELPYNAGTYGAPRTLVTNVAQPWGITMDSVNDILYVVDYGDGKLLKVPVQQLSATSAITTGFNQPSGVALDSVGNIYVADYGNSAVKEVYYNNYSSVATVGSGFDKPAGVAFDASNNLFVADTNNGAVKKLPLSDGLFGTPVTILSGLNYPNNLVLDGTGNLFVADTYNNLIKGVPYSNGTYSGTVVTLGSGFSLPTGMAVDSQGNIFIMDANGLWKLTP